MHNSLHELGISVLERGWLSSNSIVLHSPAGGHVVDTGYSSHAVQTVALVRATLGDRPLLSILNTHLHSDHCGGNAALKEAYPQARLAIPPGQATAVSDWDEDALTYKPTGQQCPRFTHDTVLTPGDEVQLAGSQWQVHAAPGHDPHAVLLYQPVHRVLISGDALWENGFGVVFPELEGSAAFADVGSTLDVIEQLAPAVVIPGHGAAFTDCEGAIGRARSRLKQFERNPARHTEYAAKVLVKFRLLEVQAISLEDLKCWFDSTPYFSLVKQTSPNIDLSLHALLERLIASGAARLEGSTILDA